MQVPGVYKSVWHNYSVVSCVYVRIKRMAIVASYNYPFVMVGLVTDYLQQNSGKG